MLNHPTLNSLKAMKLEGMAQAFSEQLELNTHKDMSFEERLALLIDREESFRDNKRFARRIRNARLKQLASLSESRKVAKG